MHVRQILAVVIVMAIAAIDGFDLFSISYAAPGVAAEWGIAQAELGIVLGADLIGMSLGSILLGAMADTHGRRPVLLVCVAVMAAGMWLASKATGLTELTLVRLLTGLGIGGALTTGTAIVAETVNDRHRDFAVTVMLAGFPIGAVAGGAIASYLLQSTGQWQAIFAFGAVATALLLVPAALFVPETIAFLSSRGSKRALERINKLLTQQGRAAVVGLPKSSGVAPRGGISVLFSRELASKTAVLTIVFLLQMTTFYFLMKWLQKLVFDMGYRAHVAAEVLMWANVGGIAGTIAISLLTKRYRLHSLVAGAMLCGSIAVAGVGQSPPSVASLMTVAATSGFFTIAANAGLYGILTRSFPTQVRAGGTGFVIGFGRAGAALSPAIAGILFSTGWPPYWVAPIMACGSLIAAVALILFMRRRQSNV